ncbi:MAG TPA: hypothetical protein VG435_13855 [Acidimicrobiales bacterium]|jgi:hypothetical protein|nr:hypothetical protein [Acidimicrobiales bacterium]
MSELVEDYIRLGLDLGRHIDGFVDAYYGPPALSEAAAAGPPKPPAQLADRARRLLSDLEADRDLDPNRRLWLAAQVRGLWTSARKLAGDNIGYLDEIEAGYGIRPPEVDTDRFAAAHRRLDEVLPKEAGVSLAERYNNWREAQVVAPDRLDQAIHSVAEDFRERTRRMFGLPDGEHVEFILESNKPWSGFNYYLGGLRSRVALNIDLPVLATSFGHVIAHEAYPGHHTEHCRKEVGLVQRRQWMEEAIFLVGTPQCVIAEGLADLALEVIAGDRPEPVIESHLKPLGIPYDAATMAQVEQAAADLEWVRGNVAIGIHDRGWSADDALAYLERWALLPKARAEKQIQFLLDPTWRAYIFCYAEGVRLCREYVHGDPARFERLISEQFVPAQLVP